MGIDWSATAPFVVFLRPKETPKRINVLFSLFFPFPFSEFEPEFTREKRIISL